MRLRKRHNNALAPMQWPADLRVSADQFALVCAANPEAVLELDASGQLIQMTPPVAKLALVTAVCCCY